MHKYADVFRLWFLEVGDGGKGALIFKGELDLRGMSRDGTLIDCTHTPVDDDGNLLEPLPIGGKASVLGHLTWFTRGAQPPDLFEGDLVFDDPIEGIFNLAGKFDLNTQNNESKEKSQDEGTWVITKP